jgi:hypothetical protein
MPDLSKMLGDVYGAPSEDEAPFEYRPASPEGRPVPEWADDNHLDAAFAGWTPGPGADAPARERKLFANADEATAPLADDLAAALSEAVLAEQTTQPAAPAPVDEPDTGFERPAVTPTAFGQLISDEVRPPAPPPAAPVEAPQPVEVASEPGPEPVLEPELAPAVAAGAWERSHDDIIPAGRGRAKLPSLSLRRR